MYKSVKAAVFTLVALLMLPGIGFTQTCSTTTIIASTPTSQFTAHDNGTITDNKTGLTWKRCSEGQTWTGVTCAGTTASYTWQNALKQAQTLNAGGGYAGNTDWRVPNVKELLSIVESQCLLPTTNLTVFPNSPSNSVYWSSSSYLTDTTQAWFVAFNYGGVASMLKSYGYWVRLVRG